MKLYEFRDREKFLKTCYDLFSRGLTPEIYTPIPEDEIIELFKPSTKFVTRGAILGALAGAIGGFLLQYIPNLHYYSLNVSGKPLNSWPAFLLITFEMGVLVCAFSIVGSFLFANRYPKFDRPVFGLEAYNRGRHENYYILLPKEDSHVEAHAAYDLSHS